MTENEIAADPTGTARSHLTHAAHRPQRVLVARGAGRTAETLLHRARAAQASPSASAASSPACCTRAASCTRSTTEPHAQCPHPAHSVHRSQRHSGRRPQRTPCTEARTDFGAIPCTPCAPRTLRHCARECATGAQGLVLDRPRRAVPAARAAAPARAAAARLALQAHGAPRPGARAHLAHPAGAGARQGGRELRLRADADHGRPDGQPVHLGRRGRGGRVRGERGQGARRDRGGRQRGRHVHAPLALARVGRVPLAREDRAPRRARLADREYKEPRARPQLFLCAPRAQCSALPPAAWCGAWRALGR